MVNTDSTFCSLTLLSITIPMICIFSTIVFHLDYLLYFSPLVAPSLASLLPETLQNSKRSGDSPTLAPGHPYAARMEAELLPPAAHTGPAPAPAHLCSRVVPRAPNGDHAVRAVRLPLHTVACAWAVHRPPLLSAVTPMLTPHP